MIFTVQLSDNRCDQINGETSSIINRVTVNEVGMSRAKLKDRYRGRFSIFLIIDYPKPDPFYFMSANSCIRRWRAVGGGVHRRGFNANRH